VTSCDIQTLRSFSSLTLRSMRTMGGWSSSGGAGTAVGTGDGPAEATPATPPAATGQEKGLALA
jgi:hypothetical protein